MATITVSHLTFGYPGSVENVFDDVSFSFDSDWRLGFVGRNGRGKTTFLNLLQQKFEYRGRISSPVQFDYFPFEISDPSQNTLDVVELVCADVPYWKIVRELTLLDIDEGVLYRPFDTLSNGEQTKVQLVALFLRENRFLLIDEPTNHLDYAARETLAHYLKSKKGFVLVSHDRDFLDIAVDHILSINQTNIEVQQGNFSSWWQNKERQDQFELAANKHLERDIKRLETAAKRTAGWADDVEKTKYGNGPVDRGYIGHKAAKMAKRAKTTKAREERAIEEKSALLKNIETADKLKICQLPYHKTTYAEVRDLQVFYDERPVLGPLSFVIEKGDRIALVGKNGSGKTSLIQCLLGAPLVHTGLVSVGSGLKISYVSQDTKHLTGSLVTFAREHHIDDGLFKSILYKLGFSRTQFDKPIAALSAGQKKKVLLAKSLMEEAHLHIWDEPLNYIDVLSRMQLETLILEHCPTLVFVEHDRRFCENIATKQVFLDT